MTDQLTASSADRHQLYEHAVQQPVVTIELVDGIFDRILDDHPTRLREDFCGTANLASIWVRSGDDRRAVAVDNDPDLIDYADRHNRRPLGPAADRLDLRRADVLHCDARAEAILALNFSYFIYKLRGDLLAYFRHAHHCLEPGGLLILDAYGGPGAMRRCQEPRDFGDFQYIWEQETYDPLTAQVTNHIHFRFPDGTALQRAFTYRWRLWTLVELRELLEEAGFDDLAVCFATPDGLTDEIDAPDMDAWVAYLIALKEA